MRGLRGAARRRGKGTRVVVAGPEAEAVMARAVRDPDGFVGELGRLLGVGFVRLTVSSNEHFAERLEELLRQEQRGPDEGEE